MTIGGWIVMTVALGGMSGLLAWCVYRVLSKPSATEHVHSTLEMDMDGENPEGQVDRIKL
jgi:hypothetical protein